MFPQLSKIKKRFWGLVLVAALFFLPKGLANWQKPIQPSMSGGPLTCLSPHPLDSSRFLVASSHQLFEGGNSSWKELWSQNDAGAAIQKIFTFEFIPDYLFVLTTGKIFLGNLRTHCWQLVYKDSGRTPLSFAVHPKNPNHWYLGTQKGLWETDDAGKKWFPSKIFSAPHPITLLHFEENLLLIAEEGSLHLASYEKPARLVFEVSQKNVGSSPEDLGSEMADENTSLLPKIHDLISIEKNHPRFFLATQNGVFESCDGGHQWSPLPQSGLESVMILQLAYSKKTGLLYAVTPRGVYSYEFGSSRWTKMFKGLAKERAQSIAVWNEEKLIAITEDGFVQYPLSPFRPEGGMATEIPFFQPSRETLALFKQLLILEPSAREVQKKVVRYANVSNAKIQRWHAGSRLAAMLPNFSFSKNMDRSASISTYSGKYITGPEDVSKGWDTGVSWNLGDMIYSSDQTSIDSREKLMVELRNDILSEATRIYYERRRLQIDTVFQPSATQQEHLERLLRIDELTSLLDGMTDGFFGKRLEHIYEEKPELNRLWVFARYGVRGTEYGENQKQEKEKQNGEQ